MPISAVRAVLETARTHDLSESNTLQMEEKRLAQIIDELLPVERPAHEGLEERLLQVRKKQQLLAVAAKYPGLPMLDPKVLSWTKRQKMPFRWIGGTRPNVLVPSLAYIPIMTGTLQMSASWGSGNPPYGLPPEVVDAYAVALRPLGECTSMPGTPSDITLRYQMPGAVPPEIKEIIHSDTRFDREQMAFICEVDKWQITARSFRQRISDQLLDPILVAYEQGALWVLGSFDPTPVEQYLINEFTH